MSLVDLRANRVLTVTGLRDSGMVPVLRVIVRKGIGLRAIVRRDSGADLVLKGGQEVPEGLLVPMVTGLPINGATVRRKVTGLLRVNGTALVRVVRSDLADRLAPTAIGLKVRVTKEITTGLGLRVVPVARVMVLDLAVRVVLATARVPAVRAMARVRVVLAMARVPADRVTVRVPVVALAAERLPLISRKEPSQRSSVRRKRKLISKKKRSFSTRPIRLRRELKPRPILFLKKWKSWRSSPLPNWLGR